MTKKKKAQKSEGDTPPLDNILSKEARSGAGNALVISRNKHWRYISNYHGPWLQLPPEALETLAHGNHYGPRPHPIDPAIFYDLVKIRKAVDEATDLAVRAASGVTSAALHSTVAASNGVLNGAAALGLTFGGNNEPTRLSKERKYRMRELATQKLSQAYHLDEIAASVATMQSTSTLEDLPKHVLQRNASDYDARYVYFFHEKIPSRMMAEYTPLEPLNALISERPHDGSPFRTRALTRVFKDDYSGAAKDLTEGLAIARWILAQHRARKDQLITENTANEEVLSRSSRDWRTEAKLDDKDQPSSLESQMLFHRAGIYLKVACQHVHETLDAWKEVQNGRTLAERTTGEVEVGNSTNLEQDTNRRHLESRKVVKTNAKKALRDYVAFLSFFEYTPGFSTDLPDPSDQFLKSNLANDNSPEPPPPPSAVDVKRIQDSSSLDESLKVSSTDALVPAEGHQRKYNSNLDQSSPHPSALEIYQVSELFDAIPPSNLPSYPPRSSIAITKYVPGPAAQPLDNGDVNLHEAVTYHPLLLDALHSLLLCHALLQTPPTELRRHAYNAARVGRLLSGYPLFLHARSTSRADWTEILRHTHNWLDLSQPWSSLCRSRSSSRNETRDQADRDSSPRNGHGSSTGSKPALSGKQRKEKVLHEAILDALADERVVDEESFHRAVRAREVEKQEETTTTLANPLASTTTTTAATSPQQESPIEKDDVDEVKLQQKPNTWSVESPNEYPGLSTERAEAIARWITEAPITVEGAKSKKSGKKNKTKKKVVTEELPLRPNLGAASEGP